ncbi:VanZ family protein [Effusibacillus consociatus]|uniref:VanZ family protein n=1 Tax=Effusibacillus consociatus TaxID=1117041 RepID=A0ABV9Q6C1_9BACL
MSPRKWRLFIWLTITILFMLLIFVKSAEPYQEQDLKPQLSAWVPLSVLETLLPRIEFQYDKDLITWRQPYDMMEFLIRKAAHVSEFAILTLLWIRTFSHTRLTGPNSTWISGMISLLYALSDEWHQTFVPNRTGHLIDVGVDSIGIALVVVLVWIRFLKTGKS